MNTIILFTGLICLLILILLVLFFLGIIIKESRTKLVFKALYYLLTMVLTFTLSYTWGFLFYQIINLI